MNRLISLVSLFAACSFAATSDDLAQVQTDKGTVAGAPNADGTVFSYKGIPFAAPPVGTLRWKAPQPASSWTGVRQATEFGARCMQGNDFGDMVFRDSGPSEDCLYLNVWRPASATAGSHLPVMVWIYGGGFTAGAASEPRQDGTNLAKKGVVVVSMNYRLGVFGFFAHPELTKESEHHASGNYGLMDQTAALQWVNKNIAEFGGDPKNVTIFGESAGSFSVCAQMATPLAHGLFHKAIGESGAFFGRSLAAASLSASEATGVKFGNMVGAASLDALRAQSAEALLTAQHKPDLGRFSPNIDGYFFPEDVNKIYAQGKQSHVPLLAGWNADEGSFHGFFQKDEATAANYAAHAKTMFGDDAQKFMSLYAGSTDADAKRAAQDYSGDQFIGFSTWKWLEWQSKTGGAPVYRYEFDQAPPGQDRGAYHSSEIEFVFGALASKDYRWREEDQKVSDMMSSYWSNFAKNGNPNGPGLPNWPVYTKCANYPVMHLATSPRVEPDRHRARYEFLESAKPAHS